MEGKKKHEGSGVRRIKGDRLGKKEGKEQRVGRDRRRKEGGRKPSGSSTLYRLLRQKEGRRIKGNGSKRKGKN